MSRVRKDVRGGQFHRVVLRAFLAAVVSLTVVGVVAFVAFAPTASAKNRATLSSLETGVLQRLNELRQSHGLEPLRLSIRLTSAADAHSTDMADRGYFDHSSPDGTPFWKRIDHWYNSAGYGFWSVGENLVWASPNLSAGRALSLWMASPEHRANILSTRWREIGVSAVHVASASGVYRGMSVTIITTDFGARQ
jgi:uncharacterized protein YkwD